MQWSSFRYYCPNCSFALETRQTQGNIKCDCCEFEFDHPRGIMHKYGTFQHSLLYYFTTLNKLSVNKELGLDIELSGTIISLIIEFLIFGGIINKDTALNKIGYTYYMIYFMNKQNNISYWIPMCVKIIDSDKQYIGFKSIFKMEPLFEPILYVSFAYDKNSDINGYDILKVNWDDYRSYAHEDETLIDNAKHKWSKKINIKCWVSSNCIYKNEIYKYYQNIIDEYFIGTKSTYKYIVLNSVNGKKMDVFGKRFMKSNAVFAQIALGFNIPYLYQKITKQNNSLFKYGVWMDKIPHLNNRELVVMIRTQPNQVKHESIKVEHMSARGKYYFNGRI